MWDANVLSQDQINVYLLKVNEIFNIRSGMTEEIALKFLVSKDYNVIQALYNMQSKPQEVKEFFISKYNRHEEKIESIGYILTLWSKQFSNIFFYCH